MTNQKKNAILKIEVNTIMGKKNVENEKLANSEHEKIKKFLIAFFCCVPFNSSCNKFSGFYSTMKIVLILLIF